MEQRQAKLLHILLSHANELFQVNRLATMLQCSEKTVRNELKEIKPFLQKYSGTELILKRGVGVYLNITREQQVRLFQIISQLDRHLTEEERTIEIAYQLLMNVRPMTLNELSKRYFTNNTVIRKDLDRISCWLSHFNLTLVSKQRIGNIISGSELNKRNAIAHLSDLVAIDSSKNYVLDLFSSSEIGAVRKALTDLQLKYGVIYASGGLESLLIHALIMIRRMRQNLSISIEKKDEEKTKETAEYEIVLKFFQQLEEILKMSFSENEKIYFTWHFISSISGNKNSLHYLSKDDQYILEIGELLIKKMENLTFVKFSNDQVLKDGLLVHLHAVLHRISYGLAITNPLLFEIKKMYPYMFNMVIYSLTYIKELYDLIIPEDEIAYLVLHFQASVERFEKEKEKSRKVLVVCHLGLGMSRLLQAKLEQQYKGIHIVNCVGKEKVRPYIKNNEIDFIISTVVLNHLPIPSIVISPLLDIDDKNQLNEFFAKYDEKKTKSNKKKILVRLLRDGLIQLNMDVEHRYQAVEKLSQLLIKKGFAKKKFAHSALVRERASATSIGGLIAIPHAQPETVKQSAVAMAVLQEPIEWGIEKVSLVFLIAITSDDQQITKDLMQEISSLCDQPARIKQLTEAKKTQDVLQLLH